MERSKKKKLQAYFFEYYRKQKGFTVIANGNSMVPTIFEGDLITVKVVKENENIKIGEIVFFKNPVLFTENLFVAHRLVKKTKNGFLTKGDNCSEFDPNITFSSIVGIVEKIQHTTTTY